MFPENKIYDNFHGSHLKRGFSKYSLSSLEAFQKWASYMTPDLTDFPDSLALRKNVSALSLMYRYYVVHVHMHTLWSEP